MDRAPRLVQAKRKANDGLVLKAPRLVHQDLSKDNLLCDDLVEASHVSKYTSANEGKYALDENSAIEGQHPVMLRDKKELSPSRDEVKEVLRLYHKVLNELLKKNRKALMQKPNIHLVAASILRDRHTWLNTVKRLESIPGVKLVMSFNTELNYV